ncbi:MAG: hypothetical protein H6708_09285 [Kofleriaceae bacterium]|nr:hypothetical protein [Kofleriaceae bacterium]
MTRAADPEPSVRHAAARALDGCDEPAAVAAVETLLGDRVDHVAAAAGRSWLPRARRRQAQSFGYDVLPAGVSRSGLRRDLDRLSERIEVCFRRAAADDDGLAGQLELRWDVDVWGWLGAVRIGADTTGTTEVATCALGVARVERLQGHVQDDDGRRPSVVAITFRFRP